MKNTVTLQGHYGGDLTHGLSAWTSTQRELSEDKLARLPAMLASLAQNEHETPFEKSALHFLVETDIATHIQLLKHRIGVSINAESARYKELKEDKFYVPAEFYKVPVTENCHLQPLFENWGKLLEDISNGTNILYHQCLKDMEQALGRKRAKEIARYFKLYNSQITADVMFNFRSFAHFMYLRRSGDAQREIWNVADEMLRLVKEIPGNPFDHTLKAFGL